MTSVLRSACVLWLMGVGIPAPAVAQEAIFVVRHAERFDQSSDAALSADGEARAEALAGHLRDAGIDAIYSTEYRRTLGTAAPLARTLGLEVQTDPTHDVGTMMSADRGVDRYVEALVTRLRERHATDRVLVVGHSNTLPALLDVLGHPEPISIAGDEYDNLFVVTPRRAGPPTVLRIRF